MPVSGGAMPSHIHSSRLSLPLFCLTCLAMPALAQDDAVEIPPVPAEIEQQLAQIPEEKRDILISEEAANAVGTWEKLFNRLEGKSPEQLEAYADGLVELREAKAFDPDRDMASIPLNTDARNFSGWKTMMPKSLVREREPGPIHLSYYANSGREGGIRTFFNQPLAIYPDDLVAGDVDVAIVGAPLDLGTYYRGQKFGPQAMRHTYGPSGNDMYTMIDPLDELTVVDYGDIAIDNQSTERSVHHVRDRVAEIARTGAIPFIIGGDHSLEYPDIAGLADVHGKGSFGVVHFDSHFDAGKDQAHYITHGQPVYRAIKEGHVKAENFIQVGLRGSWPGKWGFEWMRNNGMRYHPMPEVEQKGWKAVMDLALAEAREGTEKLFISFDVDVLDPAFVPGTGTPVPGGLTMREALPIVRGLCAQNDIVGFELVELDPLVDSTYRSALNAAHITHACLTGIAMNRQGITDPYYLSPLATDHMQPEAGRKAAEEGKAEEIDPDYGRPRDPDAE